MGFGGYEIRALCPSNYISHSTAELASGLIDADGSFTLVIDSLPSRQLILDIDFNQTHLFVTQGIYAVEIRPGTGPANPLYLSITEAPVGDLNGPLEAFNLRFAALTDHWYPFIVKGGKRAIIDSIFGTLADSVCEGYDSYLKTYVDYNIALIKQMTYKNRISEFEKKYIVDAPVREDNPAYMKFIVQYFSGLIQQLTLKPAGQSIANLINVGKDYDGLLKLLNKDFRLANDTLRELVLLLGLYEIYDDPGYRPQLALDLLDSAAIKTKIATHANLALDLKQTRSRFQNGSQAPDFQLLDETGKPVKLSSLRGKFVYLGFWSVNCPLCIQEMAVLQSLKEKFGKQISFVSVSTDKEYTTMTGFLKSSEWQHNDGGEKLYFLHGGVDRKIKADYEVRSVPLWFLIDKSGNFVKAPAESPGGDVEKTFIHVLRDSGKQPTISDPGG